MNKFEEKTITDFKECNLCLSKLKETRRRTIRVEICFTIATKYASREIMNNSVKFLQNKNIKIEMKRTNDEHVNRLGFLVEQ